MHAGRTLKDFQIAVLQALNNLKLKPEDFEFSANHDFRAELVFKVKSESKYQANLSAQDLVENLERNAPKIPESKHNWFTVTEWTVKPIRR